VTSAITGKVYLHKTKKPVIKINGYLPATTVLMAIPVFRIFFSNEHNNLNAPVSSVIITAKTENQQRKCFQ